MTATTFLTLGHLMIQTSDVYTRSLTLTDNKKQASIHKNEHTKSIISAAVISDINIHLLSDVCVTSCGYKEIGQAVVRQSSLV